MLSFLLALALAGTWLLLSGEFTLHSTMIAGFGVVSVALTLWIAKRMRIIDREGVPAHIALRFLLYMPWLIWQIITSNFDVAKRLLSPKIPMNPAVRKWKATQKSDLGRVILANSITLTPGTFTIEAERGRYTVHALDVSLIDIEEGDMDKWVHWVEGDE